MLTQRSELVCNVALLPVGMWKRVALVLLLIPLLDALFLVVVADFLGWQVTVLLVVLTALLGLVFVRAEGTRTLRRLQRDVMSGRPPTNALLDGAFLIAAGAFLLTPGLVTDALGFLFVIPPTRFVFRTLLKRFVLAPYLDRKSGGFISGKVYTSGFPQSNDTDDEDIYTINVDDSDSGDKSNP